MNPNRRSTAFRTEYILTAWALITAVFTTGLYFYPLTSSLATLGMSAVLTIGAVVPYILGGGLLLTFISERHIPYQVADKTADGSIASLVSLSPETHATYYPAVGTQITPIFSIFAVVNRVTTALLAPFVVIFILISFDIKITAILALIALALCWVVFASLNIINIMKVISYTSKHPIPMRTVNIDLSEGQISKLCRKQKGKYLIGSLSEGENIMNTLGERSIWAGVLANDLISSGLVDGETIENEIKLIEHTINNFIPNTFTATHNFFKTNKYNKAAAQRIYQKELKPKIKNEAENLDVKIWEVTKQLKTLKKKLLQEQQKRQDELVNIDETLLILAESSNIPLPIFPEFNELNFSSDQKRVVAKNIVTSSLKTLTEAKQRVSNAADEDKLDRQISKVKGFVKSLASDTKESAEREARLIKANKADPLCLSTGIEDISDVDNTIAVIDRYIESYDRSLPISNK